MPPGSSGIVDTVSPDPLPSHHQGPHPHFHHQHLHHHTLHDPDPLYDPDPELESDADEPLPHPRSVVIDPQPYISNQFYTFNSASHHLMVRCLIENRYASPKEISVVTPPAVLHSWRGVWKDRNEDTAYLTGWKRIQDKLHAQVNAQGNELLYFRNSPRQCIPYIDQWQDIVLGSHTDADLQHLGVKETIERIKQFWTVGAKLYGIPESYIKVCVASCPVCCSPGTALQQRQSSKRRRFEYTESFEVQAKEVPQRLCQLASKHQVVLCIRQKYIRFKPFLAEVKDYCCHRAGEPNFRKPGVLKRKRYSSKRCGCGFRIRAIVPITDYSEKEKTFSYLEEGQAIFKLYAVHSGHEPGPHEGSARIMHRLVGSSGMQMDTISSFNQEGEHSAYVKGEVEAREVVAQQFHDLCIELQMLERKINNVSHKALSDLTQDLATLICKLKNLGDSHQVVGTRDLLQGHPDWAHGQNQNKDEQLIDDHIDSDFGSSLGSDSHWERQSLCLPVVAGCGSVGLKDRCSDYDDNGLSTGDRQGVTDDRHAGLDMADATLVTMPVDNYYHENVKWYEGASCVLDSTMDELSHSVEAGFTNSLAD